MNRASAAINWQEVYARLEQARRTMEASGNLSPAEVKRLLSARAQALAMPLEEAPLPTQILELLVFSIAGERYGIDTAHVLEVFPLREHTPVPCTPPFVLGVVHHRGWLLPILDLRQLFELANQGTAEEGRVVAVAAGETRVGIFAEAIAGVVKIGGHEVAPAPMAITGDRQSFVQGMTGEMVAVLNLEALLRAPHIVVNEEVD
jgi:purine-binding chemotaxis protein CheW